MSGSDPGFGAWGDALAPFPEGLRRLVAAELQAGNSIAAIESGHPAAPCGASCRLTGPVRSRPRASTRDLSFYERPRGGGHSGEWTDATRHFFVLEPPHCDEADEGAVPRADAASAPVSQAIPAAAEVAPEAGAPHLPEPCPLAAADHAGASERVARFAASLSIDREAWHDGVGYAIELIDGATAEEREAILALLAGRGVRGWREVEAWAAIGGTQAEARLRGAFDEGDAEVRAAVLDHAPHLVDDGARTAHLVRGLHEADFHRGLSRILDQVEAWHPQAVVEALWRGVRERDAGIAVHFAAMLAFLHAKAVEPFDMALRPRFLRLSTPIGSERDARVEELRRWLSEGST